MCDGSGRASCWRRRGASRARCGRACNRLPTSSAESFAGPHRPAADGAKFLSWRGGRFRFHCGSTLSAKRGSRPQHSITSLAGHTLSAQAFRRLSKIHDNYIRISRGITTG